MGQTPSIIDTFGCGGFCIVRRRAALLGTALLVKWFGCGAAAAVDAAEVRRSLATWRCLWKNMGGLSLGMHPSIEKSICLYHFFLVKICRQKQSLMLSQGTRKRKRELLLVLTLIISTVCAIISSRSSSDSSLVLRDRYHDRDEVHTAMRELLKTMDKLLTAVRDQEVHAARGHGRGRSLKRARCSNRASASY